ncbi:MAG: HlyD family type I secretion periplasmic adaptor subunit [Cypionkella sp.]|jgi:HlyD family type I secretion membrane fusion protein|nr:HlyD family type I secretion periplasmic adaptor subunit [Cypionkella sp.]
MTPAAAPPAADSAPAAYDRLGGRVLLGTTLGLLLMLVVGGWAATAKLTGAVIAMGSVKVDQNLKIIQHRDGGIVTRILVREGDVVAKDQVIFELDDVQMQAELSILRTQLLEAEARAARLAAERDGRLEITFPDHFSQSDPAMAGIMAGEMRLHEGNLANRDSQSLQLELSIDQIGDEIAGLEAQRGALSDEVVLVEEIHAGLVALDEKGLVESTRLSASHRERVQLRGQMGEIDAAIARSRARIGEVRVRILAITEVARTEAQRELGVIETRVSELSDRVAAVEDRLSRSAIRAPIAGTVNELNIFTEGGVISPAEVLATIVPTDARLRIEARLSPAAIDQVYPDQPARVRFSAFNHRTTPELMGRIVQIAPATTRDEVTGEPFYLAYVEIPQAEMDRLGDLALMPGMPAEIYLSTQEQTAMAYLAKPLVDQFERAFREE